LLPRKVHLREVQNSHYHNTYHQTEVTEYKRYIMRTSKQNKQGGKGKAQRATLLLLLLDAFTIHETPIYMRFWVDKYGNQINVI
jgi:hypothetical protein